MHKLIHALMLKVAVMLLSPPKYLFAIEIDISAIVLGVTLFFNFCQKDKKWPEMF